MDRTAKILVVEDEGLVALDLQDKLIRAGYDVPEVATSADEALSVVASENPDLVLMDIRLRGGRDGIQAAHEIHQLGPVPIIFVTANADPGTIKRARASRPAGFFVKPISFASLTSSIEMALYRSGTDQYVTFLDQLHATAEEIVLIADLACNVEFVSPAVVRLTASHEIDFVGRPIADLLLTLDEQPLTGEILQSLTENKSLSIARGAFLTSPSGLLKIPVEGHAVLHRFGNSGTKVVFVLRHRSSREWSGPQMNPDHIAVARGHLASGMTETFGRLFQIISGSLTPNADSAELNLACHAGMDIAEQLRTLGKASAHTSELVDINVWIRNNITLVSKLLGTDVTVSFDLCCEPALVRLPHHSLGQILMSVFGSMRHRLAGPGFIHVQTQILLGLRENVRLVFRLERTGSAAWTPFGFPFERETNDLEISVANAIVTAAEGRLDYVQRWANAAQIEILLPKPRDLSDAIRPRAGVVLLVGIGKLEARVLEEQLAAAGYTTILSATTAEAMVVAQFHEGDVSAIVADIDMLSPCSRDRLRRAFLDRNPETKFIWRMFGSEPVDLLKDLH